jgi:DNA-binding MarR family transcriptional regulator
MSEDKPRISHMLRTVHEHYARAVDAELARHGAGDLTGGPAKALPHVPPEGIPVGVLADRVGVRKQTMAEAVEQLVATGYAKTIANPADGRSRLVKLTPKGLRARPLAVHAGDRVEANWARLTSKEDLETLRRLLHELMQQLE